MFCAAHDASVADLVRSCSFQRADSTFSRFPASDCRRRATQGAAAQSGINSDQRAAAQHTSRGRTTAETKTKRLINKQMKRFFFFFLNCGSGAVRCGSQTLQIRRNVKRLHE